MRPRKNASPSARLLLNLVNLFDLDELARLETEIGVRPDEIAGDTVVMRAAALVEWAEKNDLLYTLTVAVIRARPEAKWG